MATPNNQIDAVDDGAYDCFLIEYELVVMSRYKQLKRSPPGIPTTLDAIDKDACETFRVLYYPKQYCYVKTRLR